ncbi:MAG: LytTR family DNA-binding domain-containing protein [Eubacterium sp.]
MKFLICEDEKTWEERIKILAEKWAIAKDIDTQFICFSSPEKVVDYFSKNIDISLGEKVPDGIILAKSIRLTGSEVPIIFITNDTQRAPDGYLVDASGFLEKPIDEKRFIHFLNKIWNRKKHDKTIKLTVDRLLITIKLKDIVYIEVINHDILYHTTTHNFKTRGTLSNVLNLLDKDCFVQIHRSYIIRLEKIIGVKTSYPYAVIMQMNNEKLKLTVSRKFFNHLMTTYTDDSSCRI